jgi:hypothetical protein
MDVKIEEPGYLYYGENKCAAEPPMADNRMADFDGESYGEIKPESQKRDGNAVLMALVSSEVASQVTPEEFTSVLDKAKTLPLRIEDVGLIVQNLLKFHPGLPDQLSELYGKEPDMVGAVNIYMDHSMHPDCRRVAYEYLAYLAKSNIPEEVNLNRIGNAIRLASRQKRLERLDDIDYCPPTPARDVSILDGVESTLNRDPPKRVDPAVQKLLDVMAGVAAKASKVGPDSKESQGQVSESKSSKWSSFWASRKKDNSN